MLDLHQNVCFSVPYVVHAVNSLAIYSYFTTPSSVRVDYVMRSTIFFYRRLYWNCFCPIVGDC